MIEILTIAITILGSTTVEGPNQRINMVPFRGVASGPYFTGKTVDGGVDTQTFKKTANGQMGTTTLSARYLLEGKDKSGQACKIFIENNGNFADEYTHPICTTDCKSLEALNNDNLKGKLDMQGGGLTIRIYAPEAI